MFRNLSIKPPHTIVLQWIDSKSKDMLFYVEGFFQFKSSQRIQILLLVDWTDDGGYEFKVVSETCSGVFGADSYLGGEDLFGTCDEIGR